MTSSSAPAPAVPAPDQPSGRRRFGRLRLVRVVAHVAAWVAVALLPMAFVPLPASFEFWRPLVPLSVLAGFFYLNYWVLIPRLLARRRVAGYFGVVLLFFAAFMGPPLLDYYHIGQFRPPKEMPPLPVNPLFVIITLVVLAWVLSSALRITGEWLGNEQQRRQLHADHLAAELTFLKSQVSPHFLFNTLNNIYSLAELKSDDAPAAILRLSELMRYMLYEADAPRVPLGREVAYLQTYIELQRLRLDPGQVPIRFTVVGAVDGLLIEPMLLIPFVENAFKHGISQRQPAAIDVTATVAGARLTFDVRNRVPPGIAAANGPGGVGLQNVNRRLRLLYPGRHELRVVPGAEWFIVTLTLTLTDAALPDRR